MPMVRKRAILLIKHETTPGTAETGLSGSSDGGFNVYNCQPSLPDNVTELPKQGGFDIQGTIVGAEDGELTFEFDLDGDPAGAAAVNPLLAILLPMAGFVEATKVFTRSADLSLHKQATIEYFVDGRRHRWAGCAADLTFVIRNGDRNVCTARCRGKYLGEDAQNLPTGMTFPTLVGIPQGYKTFTIAASAAPRTDTVTFATNNTLHLLEDAGDATGYAYCVVTDSRHTLAINPEASTAKDWYALKKSGATQAVVLDVGDTNRKVSLTCANAIVRERQNPADREGVVIDPVVLLFKTSGVLTFA